MAEAHYQAQVKRDYATAIRRQQAALAQALADGLGRSFSAVRRALDIAGGRLVGGNFDFSYDSAVIDPGALGLGPPGGHCRCLGGVHFPGGGFVHLDTCNPQDGRVAFLRHLGIDVVLGHVVWTVIPRRVEAGVDWPGQPSTS
ncbi:MAG: hypothetical protein ACRD2E_10390 [Terriglobales bacterium]